MATYKEQLQKVWHAFEKENGQLPATAREAVQWGVQRGMIQIPDLDPFARLAEDMATALREEYATDKEGRRYRVNHAVRVTRGGVQHTFWAMMQDAPREHMQKAFIQRREQIVGDCVQLSTDVEAYNAMKSEQPPIPMLLDFRDDVEERRYWRKRAA
ncbi:MAG: hypothetical protein J0I80_06255 [Sphingomonas sp.]|nr:hypothetical protein [Sphingomonas sp.]